MNGTTKTTTSYKLGSLRERFDSNSQAIEARIAELREWQLEMIEDEKTETAPAGETVAMIMDIRVKVVTPKV